MSNAERQRQFRANHPGYFRKYKLSSRPAREAALAELRAVLAAEAAAAVIAQGEPVAAVAPAEVRAGGDDVEGGMGRDV